MEQEWVAIMLDVLPYKETGTYILKSPDEASQLLDDHIVLTQSMSFSPYKKAYEERINTWENTLKMTQVRHLVYIENSVGPELRRLMLCCCPPLVCAGCAGGVADLPARLALPGAHFQF